ncbi:hypothetical protein ScPMuIL_000169 [Solemya velum]
MTDFFKSALGSLISGATGQQDNDFVGQTCELGNQKLRVKRLIAEGGFAYVFVAQDVSTGKEYALKRLLANDEEKNNAVMQEIRFLKKLSGHPNVIQFIAAASIGQEDSGHGQSEYLLLTELCTGQLIDIINSRDSPLPCDQVLRVFYQTCRAVQHMHRQNPPIIHRDLKVENLLLSSGGAIKLCDFGSATTETYHPDGEWSAIKRSLIEDEIAKNTTPMYRAPEMLDLYQNFPINEYGDIWALGCVLFQLCYMEHPFEDSAKLRIINANYNLPESDDQYTVFHELIKSMLKVDPRERPDINNLVERLQDIAAARNVNLKGATKSQDPSSQQAAYSPRQPMNSMNTSDYGGSSTASALFSSLKGGAGNLVKNIKDASAKVMETVSASMNKSDLDISYITSRIIAMSFPAEGMESAFKNHIDDVRSYLEARHNNCYAVYNLAQRTYRVAKFENRVSECGWSPKKAPTLASLFAVCKNMHLWLRQNPKNVCVVHCMDGRSQTATVIGAFLVFCHLFESSQQAMHMFTVRRGAPALYRHKEGI